MEATKIKILTKSNGKRVALYNSPNSKTWFSMTVSEATKALREGKAHIGVTVVAVVSA